MDIDEDELPKIQKKLELEIRAQVPVIS